MVGKADAPNVSGLSHSASQILSPLLSPLFSLPAHPHYAPKPSPQSIPSFRFSSLQINSLSLSLSLQLLSMASSLLIANPSSVFFSNRSTSRTLALRHALNSAYPKPIKNPNLSTLLRQNQKNLEKRLQFCRKIHAGASVGETDEKNSVSDEFLVGEDSATFDLSNQKISSWVYFTGILGTVLFVLNFGWIDSSTGFGKAYIDAISGLTESHEVVMLILVFIFATYHSGMASLRDVGEKLIGERAFRVLFAGISLPLAVSTVVYFINHRYDGMQLWNLQSVPGVHQLVWISSFISFVFLYPSTFNLLEVAAVDKPKLHLWETGIMRITRHPQMAGQVVWCIAHTVWIGNSVVLAASIGLIGHHLFGVWNGDRRLASRYGETFEAVKSRTSVVPFAAILDGRQKLPNDYYKEFIRLPYLTITALTLGVYWAHPLMQAASFRLHW